MSTTGRTKSHPAARVAATAALIGLVWSITLLLAPVPAGASAPVEEPGEIVFSNHGRIVSVKADGSGRKILTRKNAAVGTRDVIEEIFPMGDSHPAISGDGSRLAFVRKKPAGEDWIEHVMVAARDGSGPRTLLKFRNGFVNELLWAGDRIVFSRIIYGQDEEGGYEENRFVSMAADGSDWKVLFGKRFRVKAGQPMAWQSLWLYDISADGSSLLYAYGDLRGSWLRLRDLESGSEHLVVRGSGDAALSPDGSRVAFVAAWCYEKQCEDSSWPKPGLWTVNADGSGRQRILATGSEVLTPDFSPDGHRIAFASDRNAPAGDSASEIYTITVGGKCLSWLTNGSPRSVEPSWAPEQLGTAPASCGANGLRPLVEMRPPKPRTNDSFPRLWAGPSFDGRLLSSVAYFLPGVRWDSYIYADCAYFNPERCPAPITIESGPVCGGMFGPSPFMDFGPVLSGSKRRGGLLVNTRQKNGKLTASMFSTGGVTLYVGGGVEAYDSKKKLTLKDHLRVIDRLRRVNEQGPASLPGPQVRKSWVNLSRKVDRTMKRAGSVKKTAKMLEMTTADVRFGLQLGQLLQTFKPLKTVQCGKQAEAARSFGVGLR